MKFLSFFIALLALSTRAFAAPTAAPSTSIYQARPTGPAMQTQRFQISYDATFATEKPANGIVTLWLPFPLDDEAQSVEKYSLGGGIAPEKLISVALKTDADYGNRFWEIKILAPAPNEKISCEYTVVRREQSNPLTEPLRRDVSIPPPSKIYLPPQQKDGWPFPSDAAIENQYRSMVSTAKPKFHNTDNMAFNFSYEFVLNLQAEAIAAKTESGFFIPNAQADGVLAPHSWSYAFHPQRGWIPMDALAAFQNPKLADYYLGHIGSDRIAFSVGQNIKLGQKGAALPVFLAPYAEDANGHELSVKLDARFKKLAWP